MKKTAYILTVFALLALSGVLFFTVFKGVTPDSNAASVSETPINHANITKSGDMISLPQPVLKGTVSLEEALVLRRSIRSYSRDPLNLAELSQLLWSAQGITNERGFRTAPSAGATFPLEMYVVSNNVEGLPRGIFHYDPHDNTLTTIHLKDVASSLARASHSQSMLSDGAAVLVFGAVFERTQARYGERGERYVYNEIGHASQNVHLQAAAMDLGTVVIGAYRDNEVEQILDLDPEVRVLYMMPVGKLNP